jgi:hypothetical protein
MHLLLCLVCHSLGLERCLCAEIICASDEAFSKEERGEDELLTIDLLLLMKYFSLQLML